MGQRPLACSALRRRRSIGRVQRCRRRLAHLLYGHARRLTFLVDWSFDRISKAMADAKTHISTMHT